jgi:geranylgeranyl diphosphate synthase type II
MLKKYCTEKAALIDHKLSELVGVSQPISSIITEAMRYSLLGGGKRLRPILLMAAADAVGKKGEAFFHVACGLEMIHTYSLIHDDLPAMDNDDYRRGKLTNHKVFGEAMAILAGDALLTAAFEVMLQQEHVDSKTLVQVVREISFAAGPQGMVGGQAIDLQSEGKTIDINTIMLMHQAKTGALFKAAIRSGALLADASDKELNLLTQYAEDFGLAFQITDDILDVIGTQEKIGKPIGSDMRNQKATYVSMYSLEGARKLAHESVERALAVLQDFGSEAEVLREMVRYLITRDS